MNKEEILEKSRAENKNQDIYEQEVLKQANTYALFVMILLAAVFCAAQIFTGQGMNYGLWALVNCGNMTTFWMKYWKLRRRHEFLMAALYTVLVLAFSVCHIYQLVTASTIS